MGNRVVITKQQIEGREYLVRAFFEEDRLAEVSCGPVEEDSLLENIYIGKLKRIVPNINAAFVELAPGQMSYLPLAQVNEPMMAKQLRAGKLTQEDEIVVQVVKEAVKTKDPTVSTSLSLKGNALVLTTGDKTLGISKKLKGEQRTHLKELFSGKTGLEFGLIVRTNAKNYTDEQLLEELSLLSERFLRIKEQHMHRTCYSCLYRAPQDAVASVRDYLSMNLERVITDVPYVYEALCREFHAKDGMTDETIVFYDDPMLSLSALYGLKTKLATALCERVWLKSGAYLIIQPTEALTVIDVNSGKCMKGKDEDFYLKVNLEAAQEVARQLRLRNISGICVVDFINLETEDAKRHLSDALKRYLERDTVPAVFEDFTKLGLAEITRKKVKKPLWEQVAGKPEMEE